MTKEQVRKPRVTFPSGKFLNAADIKVNLMHLVARALDILVTDTVNTLRDGGYEWQRESKQAFKRYVKCVEDSCYWFEKAIEDEVEDAVANSGEGWELYDSYLEDANEIVRLLLLYMDRSHDLSNRDKIFRFIREIPEQGLFTDEEIDRFRMKKL